MTKKVARDTPLAEITLRKYEKPYDLSRRSIIRKICLSTGLLQPGDSRDVIVDIFHIILDSKEELTSEEVRELTIALRKENKLPLTGIASSNVRRQLKRLRDMYFVEKVKNKYRINEKEHVSTLFKEKIEKFYLPAIVNRVKEYLDALE
jgi:DNA-binding transcriptional ArsR family regulator